MYIQLTGSHEVVEYLLPIKNGTSELSHTIVFGLATGTSSSPLYWSNPLEFGI